MAKTTTPSRDARDWSALLKPARGDALPYRQIFDQLNRIIPISQALIVSTLPRGSLQILQPPRLPEVLLRLYSKQFHYEDRPTWHCILKQRAVRARDCWSASAFETGRYYNEFMRAVGFEHSAAAPLSAPALEGYPGALRVYRAEQLGAFTDADISRLESIAAELDQAILRARSARRSPGPKSPARDRVPHQVIFDQHASVVYPRDDRGLDDRLHTGMLDYARFRIGHVNGKAVESDRVSLPDSSSDLQHFRVVVHREYPALGDGPFVFFCLQPACSDWSALRPADLQADPEVARLVPAMKFMRDQFQRGPTLHEISKVVELSPFHFHRRFTELFGITPKHFMLDCQIEHAKNELIARQKDLAQIASGCGFAHQSHFTSRFKQATGLTPTRWRRMAASAKKPART